MQDRVRVQVAHPPPRQPGIIGRTLRLMLGLLFGWMTFTVMRAADTDFNLRVFIILAITTASYVVVYYVISKYATGAHPWLGAAVAVAPVILMFAFGGSLGRVASVAYVGASLLVQVLRGDGGCEVLAIPAVLIGGRTHLACILFAPIDLVERHLTGPGGLPG